MTDTAQTPVPGNFSFRSANTAILSIEAVDAPIVVTSDEIDAQLAGAYDRLRLRPGMLQQLAGIHERRWWPSDMPFTDASTAAGERAIEAAGIDRSRIGLLIDSSVCRARLEPSSAVTIHHNLGLAPSCLNFDVVNACLGFVNGIQLASTMIDAGHIDYALVVDGEGSRQVQEATIARLQQEDMTAKDFQEQFSSLTLGSGGAAAVLGRADVHPEGHRVVGGVSRAKSDMHDICVGDLSKMRTDSRALLVGGLALAREMWVESKDSFKWHDASAYVIHQVSQVHTSSMIDAFEIDGSRVPRTFPTRGNIGPASVPYTLWSHQNELVAGDQVLAMGIGSGVNAMILEITW